MSKFDSNKYEQAKQKAKYFFDVNKKIKTACLGTIHLNHAGLRHLIRKDEHCKRDWKNQIKRFQLLDYVKQVLSGMRFYQEYLEEIQRVKIKMNKTVTFENKLVKYWSFIAIIKNKIRVKYILKQVDNGEIILWSVIPCWKTKHYKGIKVVSLHKGNPEED